MMIYTAVIPAIRKFIFVSLLLAKVLMTALVWHQESNKWIINSHRPRFIGRYGITCTTYIQTFQVGLYENILTAL